MPGRVNTSIVGAKGFALPGLAQPPAARRQSSSEESDAGVQYPPAAGPPDQQAYHPQPATSQPASPPVDIYRSNSDTNVLRSSPFSTPQEQTYLSDYGNGGGAGSDYPPAGHQEANDYTQAGGDAPPADPRLAQSAAECLGSIADMESAMLHKDREQLTASIKYDLPHYPYVRYFLDRYSLARSAISGMEQLVTQMEFAEEELMEIRQNLVSFISHSKMYRFIYNF